MDKNFIYDKDFALLSYILEKNKKNEVFTQREIAKALKISLGMTNTILKKVIKKGFVIISKIDGKKINYILTVEGLNEFYKRSIKYFKNIAKNSYYFKELVFNLVKDLKKRGVKKIVLIGNSQIDFIIEYCALKNNLDYENIKEKDFLNLLSFSKKNDNLITTNKFNGDKYYYFISENFNLNFDNNFSNVISIVKLMSKIKN